MNRHLNSITKLSTLLMACAALVFAHGGFEHVGGTVVKLENSVVTVKTTRGNVGITLDAKTEITQNGKKAQASDLKPGVKVVVDVPEDSKTKVAHAIKITDAAVVPDHDHDHDHDGHK